MKPLTVLTALAVLGGTAVCYRLGFWQISRLHEKQRLNADLHAALTAPPVEIGATPPALEVVRGRRVALSGHFDETRQILLAGRASGGSPGVDVVTPLVLAGGSAVLVDRGWMYAADAATAQPQSLHEHDGRTVVGVAQPLPRGRADGGVRTLLADSVTLWSARWLDPDSLASRFPYALAAFSVHELPGAGVPTLPARQPIRPFDEMMHISYAVQWFLFGTILLFGPLLVVRSSRRRRDPTHRTDIDPDLSFPTS